MLVRHRTFTAGGEDDEGRITTVSRSDGEEVSYCRHGPAADRWSPCGEQDQYHKEEDDYERERVVAFADELPRRARADHHRATGGGLDIKIGDLDRRMTRLAAPSPSTMTTITAKPVSTTGEGDESGEERRRSPVSPFTAVVDVVTTTTSSSSSSSTSSASSVLRLVEDSEEQQQELRTSTAHELDQEHAEQNEIDVDDDDEEEEDEEDDDEEDDDEDEEAELVDVDEDEAERAEEVAEELAAFDTATDHLLQLLDALGDDDDDNKKRVRVDDEDEADEGRVRYRFRRSRVVAVASGVRTLKQRIEDFAEPLSGFCPAQAAQLRLAVRFMSNAVVQLLNGLQAGTQTYIERKMIEVRGLITTLRPLLVQFLLEACAEAEANQDLIRQAAYLKEAAQVGIETVKLLKRAWEEMLDTSVLAANIKHMIRLCVLAADKANGMREPMAKRLKRRCLRLGKACESLMRGVRQGVEVDDQFEKLVLALSEWLAALNKAHQDIRLVR